MSFAFMPIYTGDYLRDTRHLSPLKHGVYYLALMYCWDAKGPLPLDEQDIAGICNCRSSDELDALRYILERFFVRMEDGWYNSRMQKEIERAHAIGLQRQIAGAKGYQARAKQLHLRASASTTTPTITPTPTTTTTKSRAEARASRLPDSWRLPQDWKEWALACQPTWDEGKANLVSAGFRDHWIAKAGRDALKVDWLATWRNWVRREGPARQTATATANTRPRGKFDD